MSKTRYWTYGKNAEMVIVTPDDEGIITIDYEILQKLLKKAGWKETWV